MADDFKSKPKHRPVREVGERKFYEGIPLNGPTDTTGRVLVGGVNNPYELPQRLELLNLGVGFAWNTDNAGAEQMALAILADSTGDDELALKYYELFTVEWIRNLPEGRWQATDVAVQAWLLAVLTPQDLDALRAQVIDMAEGDPGESANDGPPTAITRPWF